MALRILIVDDHPVMRGGLTLALSRREGLSVCGEAGTLGEAIQAIAATGPDLVLCDLDLDGGSGLDLIRAIRKSHPKLPVVMHSVHDEDLFAERALRAGAQGYVRKTARPEALAEAIL